MRVSHPFKLFVPSSIRDSLNEYLAKNPPSFKYDTFNFYFIFNYLLYKQYVKEESGFYALNHKHLKSAMHSNINSYIKYLINGEFILRDNYIPKEKRYHYKLNPTYKMDTQTVLVEPGTRLFDKMNRKNRNKKAHYNRLEPHLKKMKDKFMNVPFNSEAALEFVSQCTNMKKQLSYTMQIEHFKDKRTRYFARNKTNSRLDTNLTNLKSDMRSFLTGDFTHIDLKNSQPFFLNQLIKTLVNSLGGGDNNTLLCCNYFSLNYRESFGIKAIKSVLKIHHKRKNLNLVNLKEYEKAVNSGNFYDVMREHLDCKYTRDEVKDIMFKVLFSQNEVQKSYRRFIPFEDEKKVFATVFPFVAEAIQILKNKDHKALPISLTKIESYIFIDCISKELVSAGIVPLTIHDSVIVETEQAEKALVIIERVFMKYFKVTPALHVKQLNPVPIRNKFNHDNLELWRSARYDERKVG
jgi:hypothetical protein